MVKIKEKVIGYEVECCRKFKEDNNDQERVD